MISLIYTLLLGNLLGLSVFLKGSEVLNSNSLRGDKSTPKVIKETEPSEKSFAPPTEVKASEEQVSEESGKLEKEKHPEKVIDFHEAVAMRAQGPSEPPKPKKPLVWHFPKKQDLQR